MILKLCLISWLEVVVAFRCSFDSFYVLVRGKQYRAREKKQKDNGTDQIFPTESIERYEKNHIPELQNFVYHLQLKACLPPSYVCLYTWMLKYPSPKLKKTLGDRAFSSAAPNLWNNLPLHIRLEDNFERFKSLLKTHLFRLAFDM